MKSPTSCLPVLGALAALLLVPTPASAGHPQAPPASFSEGGRFTVRDVRLSGGGNTVARTRGGRVEGTLRLKHHCKGCGGAVNQVIIGLAGEERAQTCVYSGGAYSGGWKNVPFTVVVPDAPGVYEIRARYAQAWDCGKALNWWKVDRPHGPNRQATIGLIVVEPRPAPVPPPVMAPVPPRPVGMRELRAEIQGTTAELAETTSMLAELATRNPTSKNRKRVRKLARKANVMTARLQDLHARLFARLDDRPRPRPVVVVQPAPVPPPPEPVGPFAMDRAAFRELVQRLEGEGFDKSRLAMLQDAIQAGAFFDRGQALRLMDLFSFEKSQVEAAARACTVMVEPGALPAMIGKLTFDSSRKALRKRTGGQCGPPGI